MKRLAQAGRSVGLAAMLLMWLAVPGWAQSRAIRASGFMPTGRTVAPVRIYVGRVATAPLLAVGTNARVFAAPAERISFVAKGSSGVPGLGFDYVHLAAISHPSHGLNHHVGERPAQFLTPILDWGLPFYSDQQPSVIVVQEPPPTVVVEPPVAQAVSTEGTAAPVPFNTTPATPLKELGQLILVRRDGQVVLAVAFTTAGDRVTYITSEGLRHSFPIAELDTVATRQMNDANGTTLALPN